MRGFFKTAFLRIVLIATLVLLGYAVYFAYCILVPISSASNASLVVIASGDRVRDVAGSLFEKKLIRNSAAFEVYARISGGAGRIVAGEYTLQPSMNIVEMLAVLTEGGLPDERNVTFIEGWTVNDIADYLDKNGVVPKDDFLKALVSVKRGQYAFFEDTQSKSLEGYLFPDTYRVFNDASAVDVIAKALDNFDKKYDLQMRRDTIKEGKTIHEVVTLASILEGEVTDDEDRAMVADIFYRRLQKGMALQSDATVNYVTGKNDPQVTTDDLGVDSRYNTYKYKGLPPGPIGNPGLSALRAAIYPKANDYLFFLTTRDGKVIYSKTYEEHLMNKQKYLTDTADQQKQ